MQMYKTRCVRFRVEHGQGWEKRRRVTPARQRTASAEIILRARIARGSDTFTVVCLFNAPERRKKAALRV